MNTIEQNVQTFREDQFKKTYQVGRSILSINNMEHMLYAVRKAYVDLTPRTLKKLNPNASIPAKARDAELKWLASELQKYLQEEIKDDFNKWHRLLCRGFLDRFNTNVLQDNYHPMHFGKAQKIVNMALKYLRCFDDVSNYVGIYDECHMAIDSYIIDWYNRAIPETLCVPRIRKAWSNLSEREYDEIQKNIIDYLSSPMNTKYSKKRFEAEFDIWWWEKQQRLKKKQTT